MNREPTPRGRSGTPVGVSA